VVRIGSRKPIAVDVRLVAATNVDLDHAVSAGRFRLDLLYRLNIAPARLPPLRERPGDVLPLAQHFLRTYSQRMNIAVPDLSPAAVDALRGHAWPGNIRELENVIHFALLISSAEEIRPEHLKVSGGWGAATPGEDNIAPSHVSGATRDEMAPLQVIAAQLRRSFAKPGAALYDDLERLIVTEAYRHCGNNQVQSAVLLGVTRNVLRTLLKRHGLLDDSAIASAIAPPERAQDRGPSDRSWSPDAATI
jgi:DNA-binding NtrC family response regulator